jgi:NADPH:quinone reductase-like Zn-dependent oxidoreductase
MEAGVLRPNIGPRFPLEHIADAHEAQDAGGSPGKILLDIADTSGKSEAS